MYGIKKLSKESKNFYERELHQYWTNKKRLNKLIERHEKGIKKDLISSRTIIYLQERIDNIENVISQLDPFEKEVFTLIFKDNYTWLYCETHKNIHKNTYYNIFNKVIYKLAREFGEI